MHDIFLVAIATQSYIWRRCVGTIFDDCLLNIYNGTAAAAAATELDGLSPDNSVIVIIQEPRAVQVHVSTWAMQVV